MTRRLLAMTLIFSSLLSSCAAFRYEPYGYQEGWRRAQVLEIGLAVKSRLVINALLEQFRFFGVPVFQGLNR